MKKIDPLLQKIWSLDFHETTPIRRECHPLQSLKILPKNNSERLRELASNF